MEVQETRKAGRMVSGDTYIFIHVEDIHTGPIQILMGTQRLQEADLRVPGSQDDIGPAARLDGFPHGSRGLLRGSHAHVLIRRINTDKQQIVFGFEYRFQFCQPVESF
jgi:hypothetical protein